MPAELCLWPGVQTAPREAEVVGMRLNVIVGDNRSVSGLDLGSFINGADFAAGLQVSGFLNTVQDEWRGLQIAGIANAGPIGRGADGAGAQIAGVLNCSVRFIGVQAAGIMNDADEGMAGLQLAFFNSARSVRFGPQSPQFASDFDVSGVQVGAVNKADALRGVQAGFFNYCKDRDEVVVDGSDGVVSAANLHNDLQWVQIGVVNFCRTGAGVQIGLLNFCKGGPLPLLPVIYPHFGRGE
jgi:hypothetical protein